MDDFNPNCVYEPGDELDHSEGGDIYQMVWGRRHTPALFDRLARAYEVEFFVLGHQPQEFGYEVLFDRAVILASDHNHGVFLPIDCRKAFTIEDLVQRIRPFVGVL